MTDEKSTSEIMQDVRAKKKVIRFPKPGDGEGDPLTEDALALRFSERHENDLRYVATKAQWFKWDGMRWRPEPTFLAFDLARESCRADAETYGNGKPPAVTAQMVAAVTASNVELQTFLQRFMGYCCTGATDEHVFIFAYGTGANVAQETQKGRKWDEAKIKTMTGGDKITARFMRQDFFDFVPTFKLFITGNHKPRLENVDEAMRRRLLLVPFVVQIPPEERDPELPEKLKTEWPAILRWCLDGCGEWRRIGLAPPELVMEATKSYFDEQDILQEWLDDCVEIGSPSAFTSSTQLYASWKQWADDRGLAPGTVKGLSSALTDLGYTAKRNMHGRGFQGIVLRQL